MGLRPGRCYRKLHRAYTRQSRRKPRKGYVKGVPGSRIRRFNIGDIKGDYDKVVKLVAMESVNIRHNALEASRMSAVGYMEKKAGRTFFFRIRTYPHHVMRENPLATGAGADRFQQGMRQSFGKPIGLAARVFKGQVIAEFWIKAGHEAHAKEAFRRMKNKLPLQCKITVEPFDESLKPAHE